MEKIISKKINWMLLFGLILLGSCTDLNEEIFGSLTPGNFYQNEQEAISSLAGIYSRASALKNYGTHYRALIYGTDEFVIAALASGGWFGAGQHIRWTKHQIEPTGSYLNSIWNTQFNIIGAANAIIEALEESPNAQDLSRPIAEARALRAFAYFYAMDLFGNVPVFTEARVDPQNLPANNTRIEVFKFVESEFLAVIDDLPSVTEVTTSKYYRLTKEAVYTGLAKMYLNAEVYTGQEYWDEVIAMTDNVISSGGYILEPDIVDNFSTSNHNSQEIIASFSIDPASNAGGNQYLRGAMHPSHVIKYDLPFTPANGYKTFAHVVDWYEEDDDRLDFIVYGPQYDFNDNPLPTSSSDPSPLILKPIGDITAALDDEGYRVLKYIPDGNWVGRFSSNDIVWMRYADVLLMKAEAILRSSSGSSTDALILVNQVRERSNATTLSTVSLKDIYDERGREFIWEGTRRRDMIRFGTFFTETWKFKTETTPEFRALLPIPTPQLNNNPNLIQNPGY